MVALVGTTVNPKCWLLTLLPHVVSDLLQLWIWRSFEVNLQLPAIGIVAHGHDVSCQLLLLAKPSRFEMICPPYLPSAVRQEMYVDLLASAQLVDGIL